MRCFLACFNAPKHKKCRRLMNAPPCKHHKDRLNEALRGIIASTKKEVIEAIIVEPKEKLEEQLLSSNEKKKVTFDLKLEVIEALSAEEANNNLVENNARKESENKVESSSNETKLISNLVSSNGASYPPNHRYQNYAEEECEDTDLQVSELDAASENMGSDSQILAQQESSESLFSLSIDSRKQVYESEVGEKEVCSPMPKCDLVASRSNPSDSDGNQNVEFVLNPVKNLPQQKAVKARTIRQPQHQDKENINIEQDFSMDISPEPGFKVLTKNSKANVDQKKLLSQEIAVDTSLSSWLVESVTTPSSKASADSVGNSPSRRISSPRNHEDRPILGELTVKELKQASASPSPKRGTSRTPETPIIGTIGSYWSHTGQTMDSDLGSSCHKERSTATRESGEDALAKWYSTPSETRLDRALDRIIAQV